jgi:hypothetical protein
MGDEEGEAQNGVAKLTALSEQAHSITLVIFYVMMKKETYST